MDEPRTVVKTDPTQPKNQQEILEFVNTRCTYYTGYAVSRTGMNKAEIVPERRIISPPRLWTLDSNNRFRYWDIYMGIAAGSKALHATKLDLVSITEEYVNRAELPDEACGVYWTESGVEDTINPVVSAPTMLTAGKGYRAGTRASNYTTPFTQALFDAMSLFKDHLKAGYMERKTQLLGTGVVTMEKLVARSQTGPYPPWRVFAMALHDYKKQAKHIEFPCWIDPKWDGIMGVIVYHPGLPLRPVIVVRDGASKRVGVRMDFYTRSKEPIVSQDHLLLELHNYLKKRPGLHIVFEIWKQGWSLQDLSGHVRRTEDSSRGAAEPLIANVFDCFRINEPEILYEDRRAILDDLFEEIGEEVKHVVRAPSKRCYDDGEVQRYFQGYIDQGLEGGIVRNDSALYEFGLDKELRSYDTLKLKPRPDAEYPVVGFTDGNGKEVGLVTWIIAENDAGVLARIGKVLPLEERLTFRATPNQTQVLRRHIYKKLSDIVDMKTKTTFFKRSVLGQKVVVSYMSLSADKKLPTQPKVLRFHRKEMDLLLLEGFAS